MKNKSDLKKISLRNSVQEKIKVQLNAAMPALKTEIGEKKFEKRVKKAAKVLLNGLKENLARKTAVSVERVGTIRKRIVK